MAVYSFTIKALGIGIEEDNYESAFYENNCKDALVIVTNGEVFLDFQREANSFTSAVRSAVRDVELAGAKVISVEI